MKKQNKKKVDKKQQNISVSKNNKYKIILRNYFKRIIDAIRSKLGLISIIAVFGLIIAVYYILLITGITTELLNTSTKINAQTTGIILKIFGKDAIINGNIISMPGNSLQIGIGCDGSEILMLFIAAVIVFPVKFRYRIIGAVLGSIILFFLNQIRIFVLFMINQYSPSDLLTYHDVILPIFFIFATIILWVLWIKWAIRNLKKEKSLA